MPPITRLSVVAGLTALSACVASPDGIPMPEFSQRAAPRPGQDEIELLAGLRGRLAIEDGCIGVTSVRGDEDRHFTTIIWPWNARLEADGPRWAVRNMQTGQAVRLGGILKGGGGFRSDIDDAERREYNRWLTRDLSGKCAAKGTFALNREFGPG